MRKGRSSKVDYWPTLPPPLLGELASGRKEKEKGTGRQWAGEIWRTIFRWFLRVMIGSLLLVLLLVLACIFDTIRPVTFLHPRTGISLSCSWILYLLLNRLGHYCYLAVIIPGNLYIFLKPCCYFCYLCKFRCHRVANGRTFSKRIISSWWHIGWHVFDLGYGRSRFAPMLILKRETRHCAGCVIVTPTTMEVRHPRNSFRRGFRTGSRIRARTIARRAAINRGHSWKPAYPPQRSTIRCSSFAPATLFNRARSTFRFNRSFF